MSYKAEVRRQCMQCSTDVSASNSCPTCRSLVCDNCLNRNNNTCPFCERRGNGKFKCYKCGNEAAAMLRCLMCRRIVCNSCVRDVYPNRPKGVVCSSCVMAPPRPVECGRCGWIIENNVAQYYCELCAKPICSNCLLSSFECGVLKCETCCPDPIRLLTSDQNDVVVAEAAAYAAAVAERPVSSPIVQGKLMRAAPDTNNRTNYAQSTLAQIVQRRVPSKYSTLSGYRLLGQGGQGKVFKCRTADGEEVVSKEMLFEKKDEEYFEAQLIQAMKMQKLCHQHLIKYLDVIPSLDPLKISVIMPFYSEGDLFAFIRRQQSAVDEHRLCSVVLQIAGALQYLHSQQPPLVHRDIKPDNILLLSEGEQVLLMDLDLCRSVADTEHSVTVRQSMAHLENSPTFEYKAPELQNSSGSVKSDVFSLGVVTFVLATLPDYAMLRNSRNEETVLGSSDWRKDELENAVCQAIRRRTREYSRHFVELILRMLSHDPAQRPTAAEVVHELTDIMEERLLGNWSRMFSQ